MVYWQKFKEHCGNSLKLVVICFVLIDKENEGGVVKPLKSRSTNESGFLVLAFFLLLQDVTSRLNQGQIFIIYAYSEQVTWDSMNITQSPGENWIKRH